MLNTNEKRTHSNNTLNLEASEITLNNTHGILEDQDIFEAFVNNCGPNSFGPSLAKGNDFDTFWDNDGWGNG